MLAVALLFATAAANDIARYADGPVEEAAEPPQPLSQAAVTVEEGEPPEPPTQAAVPVQECTPFVSSLNNTHCSGMTRQKTAEASLAACRAYCCSAKAACNAYTWHAQANQCWVSKKAQDPADCRQMHAEPPQWIGESRRDSPPPPPPKPAVSRKRGFSGFLGKTFTCDDAAALRLNDSWFYNWIVHPSQYSKCPPPFSKLGAEYVPMINGIGALPPQGPYAREWAEANVHFLLGYNEPDPGHHPHACTPMAGAKAWVQVQQIAEQSSPPLRLVSPSISSDGWDADGRSVWLDEFLGNCSDQSVAPGCNVSLIEFIGLHDYVGNATALMRRLRGAHKRYGRKIWITEMAILGKPWATPPWTATREMQDAYMSEVLPLLDANDDVFRYAWFSARNAPNAMNNGSNLLPSADESLVPTSTGRIYSVPSA